MWNYTDLEGDKTRYGLEGSPTQVVKVFTPEPPSKGELIEGSLRVQAEKLYFKIKELKII